ncbi:MAG: MOSC domain-containing protein [Actinophytocola sp.]|uniref:MOSC and FAD-binding oxidoreductase domain-containing protein n=1 Tax=Actinophytocola sp. TaxID=1872138 RepID=UPI001324F8D7|nr:MOSC and FAD-binding oxidoreductase domain-containing protein [Actinophytocola sp.]MPZ84374.1 MOSC domain-containing protein [Actinophytocola sp.]
MATLVSLNAGMPRDVPWHDLTVHTGAWKDPVDGPRMVRRLGVEGDGQGDTAGHGGENRAVLVYQVDSYRHWEDHFGCDPLPFGMFAENLTDEGLADESVHVGDRYRIGEAELEVSQPRVTCYRAGLRLGEPELSALLVSHHRPGFYLRVIREGRVRAGDEIVRTATGPVSVADVDALLYLPDPDPELLRRAVDIPALSEGWRTSLRELLDGTADPGPAWTGFRPLRVSQVVRETETVSSLHLDATDGNGLPAARAGQYLTFRLPGAVRSYSLSSTPDTGSYRISVKRDGTGSGYLHSLRAGATLDAAAPRGEFVLDEGTGPVVLVSAGIGITPVLSMLHDLAARRGEREVWWLHTARSARDQTFADEVRALLDTLPNARAHVFHSSTDRLTANRLAALPLPPNATAYVCGPAGFMTDMTEALHAAGVARVRTETFGALGAITPGLTTVQAGRPPHPPEGPAGDGPMVTFARSGISVPFDASRRSVLALAEACDIPVRWQCRTGVCHTCVTPMLSGEVAYSPAPLVPPAAGEVLVCCARPATEVVLDM